MYEPLTPTYVGLELEYENVSNGRSAELLEAAGLETGFTALVDGSLRPRDHNTEFIFRRATPNNRVENRVRALCRDVLSQDAYMVSWRCSTHVHIDHRTRFNLIPSEVVLACLLDRVWYAWDGTGRQESKFCVPISQIWTSMLPNKRRKGVARQRPLIQDMDPPVLQAPLIGHKYTGLNIARAIPGDIGTIEYRYAAGTTDPERILEYIGMCLWCADFVSVYGTPEQIINSFVKARTFERWLEEHADARVKESFLVGARRIIGAHGPTALELEAAVMLANAA